MPPSPDSPNHCSPVALITGAARRIGACITRRLHGEGYRVLIHFHHSRTAAELLAAELNRQRPGSASTLQADLTDSSEIDSLAVRAQAFWQQLDLLVNNASSFYPTPVASISESQWDDLIGTNLKAPLWLSKALLPALR